MKRIFVVGNSGSGRTWLANRLAEELRLPVVHLDDLHWLPKFVGERPREERSRLVAEAANDSAWVMEGIYGLFLQQVLPR
jgi:adenylate kinase family enzyme